MDTTPFPGFEPRWQGASVTIHRLPSGNVSAHVAVRCEGERTWDVEDYEELLGEELLDVLGVLLLDRW